MGVGGRGEDGKKWPGEEEDVMTEEEVEVTRVSLGMGGAGNFGMHFFFSCTWFCRRKW